jgi:hypothetical protein
VALFRRASGGGATSDSEGEPDEVGDADDVVDYQNVQLAHTTGVR